jgi:hypothetical protein
MAHPHHGLGQFATRGGIREAIIESGFRVA